MIIDPHAHPQMSGDRSSALRAIKAFGMNVSSYAVIGDIPSGGSWLPRSLADVMTDLDNAKLLESSGRAKFVYHASDIPVRPKPGDPPSLILSLEGGDPIGNDIDNVNRLYDKGVRIITPVHYHINQIGDTMTSAPSYNGLTDLGRNIVARMESLGMVVDVAHSHSTTMRAIAQIATKPVIDSHTSPCGRVDPGQCGRLRTWSDMEVIAGTGGVTCTWPLWFTSGSGYTRHTFVDWANETLTMKTRLGIEHVGFGTDGGGSLPQRIDGYYDVRDIIKLASALKDAGFSHDDIAAYVGGNLNRVLQQCIG
jgi:membrane dipeptidase